MGDRKGPPGNLFTGILVSTNQVLDAVAWTSVVFDPSINIVIHYKLPERVPGACARKTLRVLPFLAAPSARTTGGG